MAARIGHPARRRVTEAKGSEENLDTGQHALIQIHIWRTGKIQFCIQVTVTGKHFRITDNTVAAPKFHAGHVVGISERQNAWSVVQAAAKRQTGHGRNVHRGETAKADGTAINIVVIPADATHADAGSCWQIPKGSAALGMIYYLL